MVDLIKIYLKAGDGGDGRISFLSNRYQMKGGPDGGNGGNGGSIVVQADRNLHSLRDFAGKTMIEAHGGQMGGKLKSTGSGAPDTVLKLPVGTTIWRVSADHQPKGQKRMYTIDIEGGRREWTLGAKRKVSENVTPRILPVSAKPPRLTKVFTLGNQSLEVEWVGEVIEDSQQLRVAAGGRGGRGNWEFRSSTHTTPREAETGGTGEAGTFFFELQVLADVGLVGFPNAGKSTLLSVITSARPEIANYPFTTIQPNLGILEFTSHKQGERATFVVADVPGIIEGAGVGKGLGTHFLRHIERCRVLLFVLALEDYDVLQDSDDLPVLVEKLAAQYRLLLEELEDYERGLDKSGEEPGRVPLLSKKRLVVINKADLYPEKLQKELAAKAGKALDYPLFISAKGNTNIEKLKSELHTLLS